MQIAVDHAPACSAARHAERRVEREVLGRPRAGFALVSATIHDVDSVFAAPTSALWRASWMGSSPLVSALTFMSHWSMATPRGNGPPPGSVCCTMSR